MCSQSFFLFYRLFLFVTSSADESLKQLSSSLSIVLLIKSSLRATYLEKPKRYRFPNEIGIMTLKRSLVLQWIPVLGQRIMPHSRGLQTRDVKMMRFNVLNGDVLLNCLYFRVPMNFYSMIRPIYVRININHIRDFDRRNKRVKMYVDESYSI